MRETESRSPVPEWAVRERLGDLAWIGENLAEFRRAAQLGLQEFGRGAVVVDITTQPEPDAGHPMWYVPQAVINDYGSDDDARMVAHYDLRRECVIILLKCERKASAYRVGLLG